MKLNFFQILLVSSYPDVWGCPTFYASKDEKMSYLIILLFRSWSLWFSLFFSNSLNGFTFIYINYSFMCSRRSWFHICSWDQDWKCQFGVKNAAHIWAMQDEVRTHGVLISGGLAAFFCRWFAVVMVIVSLHCSQCWRSHHRFWGCFATWTHLLCCVSDFQENTLISHQPVWFKNAIKYSK